MTDEPDDKVLMLVAASRLAHDGDDDFAAHLIKVYPPPINIPGVGLRQPYPDWALSDEIHREVNRIVELKLAGRIEIVAQRDGSALFEPTPDVLWRWNNAIILINPPHELHSAAEPARPLGWRTPVVSWSAVKRWRTATPARPRDTAKQSPAARRDDFIRAALSRGDIPGTSARWDAFIVGLQEHCGVNGQSRGFGDRHIKRRVADMLKQA